MVLNLPSDKPIVLSTHKDPDGDAIGSVISMFWLLRNQGYVVHSVVLDAPVHADYTSLVYDTPIQTTTTARIPDDYTGVLVDAHLPYRAGSVTTIMQFTYAIDHHPPLPTSIPNTIIDHTQPSCTAIIAQTAYNLRITDTRIYTPAYYGLIADTFSFSPVIEYEKLHIAHTIAQRILPFVEMERIRAAQPKLTYQDMKTLTKLLDTVVNYGNGVYGAYIPYSTPLFKKVLSTLMSFEDYRVAVVGVRSETGVRVSIRSAPTAPAINGVATTYGGGGHPHAAGCDVATEQPEKAFFEIVKALKTL